MSEYQVEPEENVKEEIKTKHAHVESMISEALKYLELPDVDDVSLARMFIDRGFSDDLAYWIVREANVRHAPR